MPTREIKRAVSWQVFLLSIAVFVLPLALLAPPYPLALNLGVFVASAVLWIRHGLTPGAQSKPLVLTLGALVSAGIATLTFGWFLSLGGI